MKALASWNEAYAGFNGFVAAMQSQSPDHRLGAFPNFPKPTSRRGAPRRSGDPSCPSSRPGRRPPTISTAPFTRACAAPCLKILIRLGSADPADFGPARAPSWADLRDQCRLSEHHLANEDQVIHPALEARVPGSTQRLSQAHDHHRAAFGELGSPETRQVEAAPAVDRAARLKALYLRFFRLFRGGGFPPTWAEEEGSSSCRSCRACSPTRSWPAWRIWILSALAPEEMVAMGRMMIPAATRTDRISMLGGLRANAPAEAFGAIIELAARPALFPPPTSPI